MSNFPNNVAGGAAPGGRGGAPAGGQSEYERLRAGLLRDGRLFEDPQFPAGPAALGGSGSTVPPPANVRWKRPSEIVQNPRFIVENASRFDLDQGELGDCWFIAGTACLATSSPGLLQRCVPPDQDFTSNYAGIFRFNFWHYGAWVEVVVDDRLPTVGGKLCYASNREQQNEFWVSLFEKAYAKLYGGYGNLNGGFSNNALVDFTGGISEMIDLQALKSSPSRGLDLYDTLYYMMQLSSLLGCHINATRIPEKPLPSGLYSGHAYSITNLVKLNFKGKTIKLLRIRNPWGKGEWNGAWRDTSPEWLSIPDKVKAEVGMTSKEDGEFWMSFEDWLQNFEFLTMCHLSPDSVTEEIEQHRGRQMWQTNAHSGEWVRGFNAGGCGNPPNAAMFWRNPQFGVTVGAPKNGPRGAAGPQNTCHMVVSLMQKSENMRFEFAISLFLYQLREGARELLDGQNYSATSLLLAKSAPAFTNMREVTVHYEVPPGVYVIIPCTFNPNEASSFLLRVYTETQASSQIIDVPTSVAAPRTVKDDVVSVFKRCAMGDDQIDSKQLVGALNQTLGSEGFESFGVETARCLLAMLDRDKSGLLSLEEFRILIAELRVWKDRFRTFDKDHSGDIDTYELARVFESIGFKLSRQVQESIIRRYGGKTSRLSLNDFIHSASKLVTMYDQYVRLSKKGPSAPIQVSLEQWLATTIYY